MDNKKLHFVHDGNVVVSSPTQFRSVFVRPLNFTPLPQHGQLQLGPSLLSLISVTFSSLSLPLSFLFFQRLPRWLQLCEQDAEKFPESMWKFSLYSVTWTWAVYICLFSESQYFHNLRSHWDSKLTF